MANTGGLTFELNNFDQFKRELGSLTDVIDSINKALKSTKSATDNVEKSLDATLKVFQNFATALKSIDLSSVVNFDSVLSTVLKDGGSAKADMRDAGQEIGLALIDGITDALDAVAAGKLNSTLIKLTDNIVNTVKSELGIASPSKVFEEIGKFILLGLSAGVLAYMYIAEKAIDLLVLSITTTMDKAIQGISGRSGVFSKIGSGLVNGIADSIATYGMVAVNSIDFGVNFFAKIIDALEVSLKSSVNLFKNIGYFFALGVMDSILIYGSVASSGINIASKLISNIVNEFIPIIKSSPGLFAELGYYFTQGMAEAIAIYGLMAIDGASFSANLISSIIKIITKSAKELTDVENYKTIGMSVATAFVKSIFLYFSVEDAIISSIGNFASPILKIIQKASEELFNPNAYKQIVISIARAFTKSLFLYFALENAAFEVGASIGENIIKLFKDASKKLSNPETYKDIALSIISGIASAVLIYVRIEDKLISLGFKVVSAILEPILKAVTGNPDAFQDIGKKFFDLLVKGLLLYVEGIGKIVDLIDKPADMLFNGLENIFRSVGGFISDGLEFGFKQAFSDLLVKIKNYAESIVDTFKSVLGISSPSEVFIQIGKWIVAGLIKGMEAGFSLVSASVSKLATSISESFKNNLSNLSFDGDGFTGLSNALNKLKSSLDFEIDTKLILKATAIRIFVTQLATSLTMFEMIKNTQGIEIAIAFISNIPRIVEILEGLTLDKAINALSSLIMLSPILQAMAFGLSKLQVLNFDINNVVNAVRGVFVLMDEISSSKINTDFNAAFDLFISIVKIIPALRAIAIGLQPFSGLNADSLNSAANIIPAIVKFVEDFNKLEGQADGAFGGFKAAIQMAKVFPALFILARGLRQFNEVKVVDSNFGQFTLGVKRLIDGLVSLQDVVRLNVFSGFGAFNNIKTSFKAIAEGIKEFSKISLEKNTAKDSANLLLYISRVLKEINEFSAKSIENEINRIKNVFASKVGFVAPSVGQQIAEAIVDGIEKSEERFRKLGTLLGLAFSEEFKSILGIASPSKLFQKYGEAIVDGLEKGSKDITELGSSLATKFAQAFEGKKNLVIASIAAIFGVVAARKIGGFFIGAIGDGISAGVDTIKSIGLSVGKAWYNAMKIGVDMAINLVHSFVNTAANAFNSLKDNLGNIGSTLRDVGRDVFDTGRDIAIGGGIAAFITGTQVGLAANFDQITNQIRVFGNLTQDELSQVSDSILNFSARTIFDPTQSAEAFLELQKAGLSAAESLETLNASGDLAAAGGITLTESTQGLIRVLQTFGLPMTEAASAADYLTQAANLSTASVGDLLQGFGNVGPIASQFGMSVQETVAILSMFNDAGIVGAEAGTQLKSMLVGLTRPTKETQAAFTELGVSLTDSEGNFKSINQIINELQTAMFDAKEVTVQVTKGISGEQQALLGEAEKAYAAASRQIMLYENGLSSASEASIQNKREIASQAEAIIGQITGSQEVVDEFTASVMRSESENFRAIQQLAGSFGGSGLAVLLSQDEDAINNFITEMGELPGAADISAEMMNTFAGSLESLRGSFETLIIKALLPVMKYGLKPLTDAGIKLLNMFSSLPQEILGVVAGAVALGAALTTLVGIGMMLIGGVAVPLGFAFSALSSIMAGLAFIFVNPLGLLAGAAAFGTGLILIVGTVATVTGGIAALTAGLMVLFNEAKNNDELVGAFNGMKESVSTVLNVIKEFVSAWIDLISKFSLGSSEASNANSSFTPLVSLFNSIKEKADALAASVQQVTTFIGLLSDTYAYLNGETESFAGESRFSKEKQDILDQIDALEKRDGVIASSPGTHTVQGGDNLSKIAKQYGIDLKDLIAANEQLSNPNLIRPGQEIFIPGLEGTNDELVQLQEELEKVEERERMFAEQSEAMGFETTEKKLSGLQERFTEFASTDLGAKIFGFGGLDAKAPEFEFFVERLGEIEGTFTRIGNLVGDVKDGIFSIFSGDISGGISSSATAIQRIAGEFTNLIEQTTGIDIGNQFQNILLEGTNQELIDYGTTLLGDAIWKIVTTGFEFAFDLAKSGVSSLFNLFIDAIGIKDNENLMAAFSTIGDSIKDVLDTISNANIDLEKYSVLFDILKLVGGAIVALYSPAILMAFGFFMGILKSLGSVITVLDGFVEVLYGIAHLDTESISNGLKNIFSGLTSLVPSYISGIADALAAFLDLIGAHGLSDKVSKFSDSLSDLSEKLINGAWDLISSKVNGFFESIQETLENSNVIKAISRFSDAFGTSFAGVFDAIKNIDIGNYTVFIDIVSKAFKALMFTIDSLLQYMGFATAADIIQLIGNAIWKFAGYLFDLWKMSAYFVGGVIFAAIAAGVMLISGALRTLGSVITVLDGFVELIRGIAYLDTDSIGDGLRKIFGGLASIVPSFLSGVADALAGFLDLIGQNGLAKKVAGVADGLNKFANQIKNLGTDKGWNEFTDGVKEFFSNIDVVDLFESLIGSLGNVLPIIIKSIFEKSNDVASDIWNFVTNIWNEIKEAISSIFSFDISLDFVSDIWNSAKEGLSSGLSSLSDIGSTISSFIPQAFQGVKDTLSGLFSGGIDFIGDIAGSILNFVTNGFNSVVGLISSIDTTSLKDSIISILTGIIGEDNLMVALTFATKIFNFVVNGLSGAANTILTYDFSATYNSIKDTILNGITNVFGEESANKVLDIASDVQAFVLDGIDEAANLLGFDSFNSVKDKVSSLIKDGFNLGEDVVSAIGNEIKGIFSTGFGDASLKIEGGITIDDIKDKISNVLKSLGVDENTISEMGTKIKDAVSGAFDSASSLLDGLDASETLTNIKNTISSTVSGIFGGLDTLPEIDITKITKPIKDLVDGIMSAVGGFDNALVDTVINGVKKVAEVFGLSEELGLDDAKSNIEEMQAALSELSTNTAGEGVGLEFILPEGMALSEEQMASLRLMGETFTLYIAEGMKDEVSLATLNSAASSLITGVTIDSATATTKLDSIKTSIVSLATTGGGAFIMMQSSISQAVAAMTSTLNSFSAVIGSLTTAIQNLIGQFLQAQGIVASGNVAGAQSMAAGWGGGRAFGGAIEPNKIYEFNEQRKGVPFEIFQTDGRNYLLSSERGYMQSPLTAMQGFGGGQSTIYQDNSTIYINGSGLSQEELTSAIVNAKRQEQQNNPFMLKAMRSGNR